MEDNLETKIEESFYRKLVNGGLGRTVSGVIGGLYLVGAHFAHALPPAPAEYWGKVNDGAIEDGLAVEGKIDGVKYSQPSTTQQGYYLIVVPGDDSDTPEKEGGVPGDEVTFYVDGDPADPTVQWNSGSYRQDISVIPGEGEGEEGEYEPEAEFEPEAEYEPEVEFELEAEYEPEYEAEIPGEGEGEGEPPGPGPGPGPQGPCPAVILSQGTTLEQTIDKVRRFRDSLLDNYSGERITRVFYQLDR